MNRIALALIALLVLTGFSTAFGQEGEQESEELGVRERWMLRDLTERLNLSEEQQAEIKKALLASAKATEEAIRKSLSEEQAKQYDELQAQRRERSSRFGRRGDRGGERGGQDRGRRRRGMGSFGIDLDELLADWKKRLNLDDAQVEKIRAAFDAMSEEVSAKFMEAMRAAREEGGERRGRRRFDYRGILRSIRPDVEKMLEGLSGKIREVLKEDQVPEFEKAFKEYADKVTGYLGGDSSRRREDGGRRGRSQTPEQRLESVMAELKVSAEEAAVLKPLCEKVIRFQADAEKKMEETSAKLRELVGKADATEALKASLDGLRTLRKENAAKLKTLQDNLRELLTFEQEALLVVLKVLD
ncbi:MAG: hypothetical protein ACYTHM_01985 [Planctomycetota bacterium]|jgi:hypothetical protein